MRGGVSKTSFLYVLGGEESKCGVIFLIRATFDTFSPLFVLKIWSKIGQKWTDHPKIAPIS